MNGTLPLMRTFIGYGPDEDVQDKRHATRKTSQAALTALRPLLFSASLALLGFSAVAQPSRAPAPSPVVRPPATAPAKTHYPDTDGGAPVPLDAASAKAKAEQIIVHLRAVVHYYHLCKMTVQQVGEPSDSAYVDKLQSGAKEVASYALQFGTAATVILSSSKGSSLVDSVDKSSDDALLESVLASAEGHIQVLQEEQKQLLATQSRNVRGHSLQELQNRGSVVDRVLQLNVAMRNALNKILSMTDAQGRSGLLSEIEHLQRALPELSDSRTQAAPLPVTSVAAARSAGIVSQTAALVELVSAKHTIDQLLANTEELHHQALELRTPLGDQVRLTYLRGEQLSDQAGVYKSVSAGHDPRTIQQRLSVIGMVTDKFDKLSATAVPLYEEIVVLEQSKANLLEWRAAAQSEYKHILTSLLLRVAVILSVLAILLLFGEAWRRATIRYVRDQRRRRQLLGMRRIVVGFLGVLVVLFGCVTQFNSLTTFAGFITAGLAVGLQTILLSVAAYFFIIGKYGIRVGDRITVSGVTGDVIDVGLVRFYLMEFSGAGTDLAPTGRVAVFSNAVLFQAGTPLYKQMPGTDYAWHQMSVPLKPIDYGKAAEMIHKAVEEIYAGYRDRIERQHHLWESSMEMQLRVPAVESALQLTDQQLRLLIRFPVQLHDAEAIDQQVAEMMVSLMQQQQAVKESVLALPTITATTSAR